MQKLPSSMPRYVKSASFLQFHVVLVCFWTIGPIWTICCICGFLRSFAAKSPKVQKLLNVGRSRICFFSNRPPEILQQGPPGFCCPILSGCLNCLSALEISEKGPQKTSAASHPENFRQIWMPNLQQTKKHDARQFCWRCLLIWKWANRAWIRLIWWYDPTNTLILYNHYKSHWFIWYTWYLPPSIGLKETTSNHPLASTKTRVVTRQLPAGSDLPRDDGVTVTIWRQILVQRLQTSPSHVRNSYPTRLHESEDVQCEAPKIAKLVYNSNNYGLWYLYNYSYWGEFKPTFTSLGGLTL